MAKLILICGKLCSGKTTYAKRLQADSGAVLLSVDEIMLAIFGQDAGDRHDEYTEKIQRFLFDKAVEIINAGADVIFDWGFWQKARRDYAREFCKSRGITCEVHYLDVDPAVWCERIERRNSEVLAGNESAYVVDGGLLAKFEGLFEEPERDEVDVVAEFKP